MGLFSYSFKASRCKAQLQMVIGRKRLQKNKKELANKATRKGVAEMLAAGKLENAAIKVESVLQEEALLKAFELIELYAELLSVRMALIEKEKTCPEDMREAVASLVFAAPTVSDLPELLVIRKELAAKYTKEWVQETTPMYLNPDLREWLTVRSPDPAVKFERLQAIAEEHNVTWDAEAARVKLLAGRTPRPSQVSEAASMLPQPAPQQMVQPVLQGTMQAPPIPQQQVVYVTQQPQPEVLMAQPVQLTYAPAPGTMAVQVGQPAALPAGLEHVQGMAPPAATDDFGDGVACGTEDGGKAVGPAAAQNMPPQQQQDALPISQADEKQAQERSKDTAADNKAAACPTLDDVLKVQAGSSALPSSPAAEGVAGEPPPATQPLAPPASAPPPPPDELDELEARFAALKRG